MPLPRPGMHWGVLPPELAGWRAFVPGRAGLSRLLARRPPALSRCRWRAGHCCSDLRVHVAVPRVPCTPQKRCVRWAASALIVRVLSRSGFASGGRLFRRGRSRRPVSRHVFALASGDDVWLGRGGPGALDPGRGVLSGEVARSPGSYIRPTPAERLTPLPRALARARKLECRLARSARRTAVRPVRGGRRAGS